MENQHGKLTLSKYIENLPGYNSPNLEQLKLDSKQAYGNCFAYNFVKVTDNSRTVKLKENLSNQLYLGVNSYSHGLPNETNMIINCKNCVNNPNHTGKKKQQLKKYLKK